MVSNYPVALSAGERETYFVIHHEAVVALSRYYAESDKGKAIHEGVSRYLPYIGSLLIMLRQFCNESPTFKRIEFEGTYFFIYNKMINADI